MVQTRMSPGLAGGSNSSRARWSGAKSLVCTSSSDAGIGTSSANPQLHKISDMPDAAWSSAAQTTIPELFERRLSDDPDGEYLDMVGTKLTARQVMYSAAGMGGALGELGTAQGDRVATLIENSAPAL